MSTPKEESTVSKIRRQSDEATKIRRSIAFLNALGILGFIPISLYQSGVIAHLPDPSSDLFDSDYVNASKEAQVAGIPDGPVSLLMYAANLVLTTEAIKNKGQWSFTDYLMAGNVVGQAAGGAYYLYNMATKQKRVCLYCITGALINFATLVPLYKLFKNTERSS